MQEERSTLVYGRLTTVEGVDELIGQIRSPAGSWFLAVIEAMQFSHDPRPNMQVPEAEKAPVICTLRSPDMPIHKEVTVPYPNIHYLSGEIQLDTILNRVKENCKIRMHRDSRIDIYGKVAACTLYAPSLAVVLTLRSVR